MPNKNDATNPSSGRDSFVFYKSFYEAIQSIEPDSRLAIWDAICRYCLYGEEANLKGIPDAIWLLIKPQLDASNKRYLRSKENGQKGKEFGKLGGRPKKHPNSIKSDSSGEKKPLNVNANVNANVNHNENIITADAENDSPVGYYFDGKTVKLNKDHYGEFRTAVPKLTDPEYDEALVLADNYFTDGNPARWFFRLRYWLKKQQDQIILERKPWGERTQI